MCIAEKKRFLSYLVFQFCMELNQGTHPSIRKWKWPRGLWKSIVSEKPTGHSSKVWQSSLTALILCYDAKSTIFYTHLTNSGSLNSSLAHHRATQRKTLTLTPRVNVKTPINITCMFLGRGRKLEYLERTHTYMGRTQ